MGSNASVLDSQNINNTRQKLTGQLPLFQFFFVSFACEVQAKQSMYRRLQLMVGQCGVTLLSLLLTCGINYLSLMLGNQKLTLGCCLMDFVFFLNYFLISVSMLVARDKKTT